MKTRTIEELHDKHIGHVRFARFVDAALKRNHTITNIREYNEKFKFDMDEFPCEFDKTAKFSWKWYLEYCEQTLERMRKLKDEIF